MSCFLNRNLVTNSSSAQTLTLHVAPRMCLVLSYSSVTLLSSLFASPNPTITTSLGVLQVKGAQAAATISSRRHRIARTRKSTCLIPYVLYHDSCRPSRNRGRAHKYNVSIKVNFESFVADATCLHLTRTRYEKATNFAQSKLSIGGLFCPAYPLSWVFCLQGFMKPLYSRTDKYPLSRILKVDIGLPTHQIQTRKLSTVCLCRT